MAEAPMDVDDDYEKEDAEGGYEKEETPTSVSYAPWLFERRQENEERNVYQLPDESGKWMMFYHVDVINDAWSRAKTLYRFVATSFVCIVNQVLKVSYSLDVLMRRLSCVLLIRC